jgi:hypothetical protein
MTGLKTLKEIEVSSQNPMFTMGADDQRKYIRIEVIKWVKELNKMPEEFCLKCKKGYSWEDNKCNCDVEKYKLFQVPDNTDLNGIITFLTYFFNITEDELL